MIGALVGAGLALVYVVGTAEQRPAGQGEAGAIIGTGLTWGALGALIGTGFDSWKPVHLGVERLRP